ncbi:hypothetical protein MW290_18175 [Aquincola tertiaricarbonis]|uniref:Uncharacterized protein n=1 Tax=Aquincola tertiaricarbonis TaxID=391953 RepID=A0ABY4SGM0_AQUTE|nr:hypothetical protein [Aquincola tertiaricarbonis]URI10908.1 hypothetical protein MW290_18175 [Aquincola tertiaricarbonis]
MAPSQHRPSTPGFTPECQELRDERAPRRLKALRAFVAVSALGWLAFAVLVSATTPEPLPPDLAASIALGEAGSADVPAPRSALAQQAEPILVSQDTSQR